MPILALGVSYRRAPVELLERLAFTDDEYPKAYRLLLEPDSVTEGVVLSTCNRVEVYAQVASYHSGFQELKRFLSESREVPPEDFAEPLYSHYEAHAAEHLFSVAAGADSVILGEPQILTQVRQAFRRSQDEGATGSVLSALFRGAIRAGRRARAETAIASSPSSFVSAGLDLAERGLGSPLAGRPAVVVGAGAMASLALAGLRQRGAAPIRVVNRSVERALRLAATVGAEPGGLESLVPAMARADLVVSSTGAARAVIGVAAVHDALRLRTSGAGPLFLVDLAVPRDVDPGVSGLPGVHLADLDDVRLELMEGTRASGADGLEAVRAVIEQEVAKFESWRRAARLAPLIQALRGRGDRAVAAELRRLGPKLTGLSDRQRMVVEALARGVVAKLLHDPVARLKAEPPPGADVLARALAELFGIEPPGRD
jgi:glutamyl-tRNA reductase